MVLVIDLTDTLAYLSYAVYSTGLFSLGGVIGGVGALKGFEVQCFFERNRMVLLAA
jgi:hypothetical protein